MSTRIILKRMSSFMSKNSNIMVSTIKIWENVRSVIFRKRSTKTTGGFCTSFPKYNRPYIFSNFNGTDHDITVLTHEAGHAFQNYSSTHQPLVNYHWPTMEAAEIHSMSMEFFTWPWMRKFFKEDTEKFKYKHVSGSLSFLPYGACVDHFQH